MARMQPTKSFGPKQQQKARRRLSVRFHFDLPQNWACGYCCVALLHTHNSSHFCVVLCRLIALLCCVAAHAHVIAVLRAAHIQFTSQFCVTVVLLHTIAHINYLFTVLCAAHTHIITVLCCVVLCWIIKVSGQVQS